MKKIMIPILALILLSRTLHAQDISEIEQKNELITEQVYSQVTDNDTLVALEENRELILDDSESDLDIIKSIPADAWALVKAPIGWTKKEWLIAGGVVTITSMLMVGDNAVRDFFQNNRTSFTEDVAYLAEKGGSQAQVGIAASYLIGTILKDKKLKKASVLAFTSLLISGVVVQGLKHTFGRVRPYEAVDQWQFTGPLTGNVSFPSGHTTSAFAVAASIATIYDSKLVKILAYSAATLTGLSRIHDNKHWMSDVFMGAILGTATGIFITKRHMNSTSRSAVQLSPAVINVGAQTGYGVGVTIRLDGNRKKKKRPLYE